jgi:hypothetical protein
MKYIILILAALSLTACASAPFDNDGQTDAKVIAPYRKFSTRSSIQIDPALQVKLSTPYVVCHKVDPDSGKTIVYTCL